MLSLFRYPKKRTFDAIGLDTDMHSHLIPGIDDGAKNMQEALELVQSLVEVGFKHIITTPHIMGTYYPNTPEIILSGLKEFRHELNKQNIEVSIDAAAEYFLDDFFADLIDSDEPLLTLPGNHVLIELSTFAPPRDLLETIFKLNTKGYKPILAHPERYIYYSDKIELFKEMKSFGCELQLNLLSLTGHYGTPQRKLALKLLKHQLIDYVGTDTHHKQHIIKLQQLLRKWSMLKILRSFKFFNQKLK